MCCSQSAKFSCDRNDVQFLPGIYVSARTLSVKCALNRCVNLMLVYKEESLNNLMDHIA